MSIFKNQGMPDWFHAFCLYSSGASKRINMNLNSSEYKYKKKHRKVKSRRALKGKVCDSLIHDDDLLYPQFERVLKRLAIIKEPRICSLATFIITIRVENSHYISHYLFVCTVISPEVNRRCTVDFDLVELFQRFH